MEEKKQIKSTKAQRQKLTEYMSLNRAFANGEFSGPLGSRRMEEQWAALKGLLKELGPDKSVDQWKQSWRDIKRKARQENARASSSRDVTGNPDEPVPVIKETTSMVLDIIGHECSTGTGPSESGIGRNIPMTKPAAEALPSSPSVSAQEDVIIIGDLSEEPAAGISAISVDALQEPAAAIAVNPLPVTPAPAATRVRRTRQRPRRGQNQENVPAAFLAMQQDQNRLLKRMCDLMEERNIILRQQNRLEKKRKFLR